MADVKISALPSATTPLAGTEQIPLVQSGATKKVTVNGLFTSANLGTPSAVSLTNATNVPVDQAVGVLPVNHGGTGTTTPALVAGTNVTISGSWPNQTINSVAGAVTGVTATAPVVSSGGTAPVISMAAATASVNGYLTSTDWNTFNNKQPAGSYLTNGGALGTPSSGTATNLTGLPLTTGVTGLLPVANGGTGTATPALVAGTNVTISGTWPNQTINASGGGGSGDVTGPGSSTDNAVARFDSTTGKIIQNSGVVINDSGEVTVGVWKGTEVGLSYGGTGAASASQARGNILPSYTGNAGKVLAVNTGATDVEYISAGGTGTVTSVAVSGGTTGLTTSGGPITAAGTITLAGTLAVANGGTGVTTSTGTGNTVLSTSPSLTTPSINQINDTNGNGILGLSPTTSAVDYLTVKNGIGVGVPLHFYADGASANIGLHIQPKGTGLVTISDGTDFNKGIRFRSSSSAASAVTLLDAVSTAGRVVTLPDATTTLVGRDTTDTLTNKTINLTSNTLVATSAQLATAVTDETGSGSLVFATSPTLVTPILGTPTSGNFSTGTFTWPTFNQNTSGTAAGLSATLSPASGGTGVANNASATVTSSGNFAYTRTLTGATNVTFPTTGTLATLAGTETFTNKTVEAGTFTNGYTEEVATANTSTAYTIDLAGGSVQILTLTGNCTYTFPTPVAGKSFILVQKQDATGSRTVTWPASVDWPSATAPTLTATALRADKFVFTAIDSSNWLGSVAGQNYTV
jgi:trimeric autotransporter adhesin